jgi:hypothetical protein
MIYNETYIGTARDVEDLVVLLRDNVRSSATIELASRYPSPEIEVWYDREINTVILK